MNENDEKNFEEIEQSYLQLVRVSKEIHTALEKKRVLIDKSYKKYLRESILLLEKWNRSSEKDKHLYEKDHKGELPLRINDLKKTFIDNMHSVKVRLRHLDPIRQYIEKGHLLMKKFRHYHEKDPGGKEEKEAKAALQSMLGEFQEGGDTDSLKSEIANLLKENS